MQKQLERNSTVGFDTKEQILFFNTARTLHWAGAMQLKTWPVRMLDGTVIVMAVEASDLHLKPAHFSDPVFTGATPLVMLEEEDEDDPVDYEEDDEEEDDEEDEEDVEDEEDDPVDYGEDDEEEDDEEDDLDD
jgi:hypothetical protein